ncbi:MAG: insulinase family protein [Prolixibacteraceae bacterium]|nr:insulinase family protein [Prolixibacteraceae bacterium]
MKKNLLKLLVVVPLFAGNLQAKEAGMSIPIEKYTLKNGLTVVLHEDKSDPIAAVAVYYHVGSSREVTGKTGFAHLFEHMMFQKSENVPEDQFFKNIQGAGGTLNGSTNQDRTNYYEVVPKNALEMALWMESDRMGYLENMVTKSALVNQQNVVQNEKRESVDNAAYGFNQEILARTLYPKGHPYSWTVIGDMKDLTNATVEDVKAFHHKFYSPNNATLVVAGDIDKVVVKAMIEKYFGEISKGEPIGIRKAMPVSLPATVKLYQEDNFAKVPMLTMVFPTAERYSKDAYALNFLGELMAGTKKSPLYTILVKDKKLTSRVMARNGSQELAGSFTISVTANPGGNLNDIEKAIFEGFDKFEKDWFSEEDLTRIKANDETRFYNSFESVQSKAFTLAEYNIYAGDPEFYKKDLANTQAVTMADVKAVYNKYLKGKNFVETSFVPKGEAKLIVSGSVNAGVVEEDVTKAAEVKDVPVADEAIVKTKTKLDRSIKPVPGPDPEVTIPKPWSAALPNGLKIWGISQTELPMVQYTIKIAGGHKLDNVAKAGVANLVATMMNEGTKNKTPEELEDAIGLLGASIRIGSSNEDITMEVGSMGFRSSGGMIVRNFEKSLALVEEMLLEPRWDKEQFALAKSRIINGIKRNSASPEFLASKTLNKLIFGDNVLAIDASGTESSVAAITLDDLKEYYNKYISPSISEMLVVGNIDEARVMKALASLNSKWAAKKVEMPEIKMPAAPEKSQIYFVDVPGAKQSVISIGAPSITRSNSDFYPAYVANYKLGGSFNGILNLILREEKGFTYGARSSFSGSKEFGQFVASSKVRTNSTLESVTIFKTEMEKYRKANSQEYVDFTKSSLLKGNALRFETLSGLMGMLNTMTENNLPANYIKTEEAYVKGLTIEKQLQMANKYIDPARMYYVVVGDAKTQLEPLEAVGLGKPILFK